MTIKNLISGATAVGTFNAAVFSATDKVRLFQFVPIGGFTGSVTLEGSINLSPSNSQYTTIANVTFSGHANALSLEVLTSYPNIRARVDTYTSGGISLTATSITKDVVSGSQGSSPFTAFITSALKTAGNGTSFKIESASVPAFTTDDIFDATSPSVTLTTVLASKQNGITGSAVIATGADLNLLSGTSVYGLTVADLKKLADVSVSASALNFSSGVSSNIQAQLNALSAIVTSPLNGATTTAAHLDGFFNTAPTVTITDLNNLAGMVTGASDLSVFQGTAGQFTAADMIKLNGVSSTAVELSKLSGFTGAASDLNKVSGLTSTAADLDAISGYAATGVTSTQLANLNGLTQNVQSALNSIPSGLNGLTASANDLQLLTGASAGTGIYSGGSISALEVSYLNGLTSNLQTQLDAKRNTATSIGIAEISGASVSITELNYLSGLTSNVQTQLNAFTSGYLSLGGGTLIGNLITVDGTLSAPAIGFTSNAATGMFYNTGTIAFGVNGVLKADISATGLTVGAGLTGEPLIQITGTSTSPNYTFVGDTGTGLVRSAAGTVELVANAKQAVIANGTSVVIGGAAVDNTPVTVSGMFGGSKLLSSTVVEMGASGVIGQIPLYTVPVGRTLIVTSIVVELTAVVGYTSNSVNVSFGVALPNYDEFLNAATSLTKFNGKTTASQAVAMSLDGLETSGSGYVTVASGAALVSNLSVVNTSTTYTTKVHVFGYEY